MKQMYEKAGICEHNAHKLEEVRALFSGRLEVVSLADIGCHEEIPETADTLEGNGSSSSTSRLGALRPLLLCR